jgi:uncharacterized double-CXXCG motif protein
MVRPLLPSEVHLGPGTEFGPLVGSAKGTFSPLFMPNPWTLLCLRGALEQLNAAGPRGLKGCRTELRFRQKNVPELLELEIVPYGLLHPDCLPPDRSPTCRTCGRESFSRPEDPILDEASLPKDFDLFRVANWPTMIIGGERFKEAVERLELEGVICRELPLR